MQLTIGFSKSIHYPNRFCSQLISAVEGTSFSHVYIRWDIPSIPGLNVVYQAGHGFLHFCEFSLFQKSNEVIAEFKREISDIQYRKILEYCLRHAGVKYGLLQLVGMGIGRIFKFKNPFEDGEKTMVCSELVSHILQILGETQTDYDAVSPKDLYTNLSQSTPPTNK